jgi:hypothetical protein
MSENDQSKQKDIKGLEVKIDTERTEALARENERLKMKLEKGESVETGEVHDLDERKIKFYQDFEDPRILECKSSKELHELMNSIIKTGYKNAMRSEPTGEVSLNERQLGTKPSSLRTQKFDSIEQMVRTLKEVASDSSNPEQADAKLALNQLMTKAIAQIKNTDPSKLNLSYSPNPQLPEGTESKQPIELHNPSELKTGVSEIRECLNRANEIARAKHNIAAQRFFREQEKSEQQKRSKEDSEAKQKEISEA